MSLAGILRLVLLLAAVMAGVCLPSARVQAQCADDSEVTDFKVRDIKVKALWGNVPEQLRNDLAKHRGDSYSNAKGSEYAAEVRAFMNSDPSQKIYERLVSGRLKGSFRVLYQNWCAHPLSKTECEQAFGSGVAQCIDLEINSKIIQADL